MKNSDVEIKPKYTMLKSIIFIILGLAALVLGSNLVVNNATTIATNLGISERVISLTVIAIGTSLPELVTTIVSSIKKEQDLLLGNIIGSNIFNLCIVLGIPVAIYGTITPESFKYIDLVMLLLSSILLFIFSISKKKISRIEGLLMLLTFIIYYSLLFIL